MISLSFAVGFILIISFFGYFLYPVLKKYIRLLQLSRTFLGPPTVPFLGNGHELVGKDPEDYILLLAGWIDKYGDCFRVWLGPEFNIFLSDLKMVEAILGGNTLLDKASEYDVLDEWLREGLLVSTGRKWFKRRKVITPAFHFRILEQFIEVFDRQSKSMIEKLSKFREHDQVDIYGHTSLCALDIICGRKWFKRRKIITPAFHFRILEQFVEIFNAQSNVLVDILSRYKSDEAIDIYPHVTVCALDVICETAMGVSCNAQINSDSKYVQAVKTLSMVLHKRMFDVLYRYDFIFRLTPLARVQRDALKIIHDFSNNVIVARRNELLRSQKANATAATTAIYDENENSIGAKKKMAFLDILLQSNIDGEPLNNRDIQEEVDTFMFEGHDTTTSAITFCFYNLATNPEAQRKCFEEIRDVIGADKDKAITFNDLNNLNYMELAIKETLRLFPSVPLLGRKVVKECTINGKRFPAGTNIGISPFVLGRREAIFSEAHKFIPERFDSSSGMIKGGDKMNPYSYIPFSAGPRNCIGQKFAMLEIKSTVSKVLRHFEVDLVKNQEEPILLAELILKTKKPLLFHLKPRVYSK